jgi:hypothetical protein
MEGGAVIMQQCTKNQKLFAFYFNLQYTIANDNSYH